MTILITAAAGMLGRDLVPVLDLEHDIVAVDLPDGDLTDPDVARRLVAALRPTWVVNCAAYTAVDRAEAEPDLAFAVNQRAPANLAAACRDADARLLHLSTDYVFAGDADGAHRVDDPTGPLSVYGKSKLAGEIAVRETLGKRALILRTAWLFGPQGPNFVAAILRQIAGGNPLRVVDDQTGAPTYTVHLAEAIAAALRVELSGTHHVTGDGFTTWFEFAVEICRRIGRDDYPVEPVSSDDFPRPAPRPKNSRLDNTGFVAATGHRLPLWQLGLAAYLARVQAP